MADDEIMKKTNSLFDCKNSDNGEWKTINGAHIFIEDGADINKTLTKSKRYGIINTMSKDNNYIDIEIDNFSDCLVDRVTGHQVDTEVYKISIQPADYIGWKFDWNKEAKDNVQIFALRLKGQKDIQGLIATRIEKENSAVFVSLVETAPQNYGSKGKYEGVGGHLFAEAIKQSYSAGYDGFIYFRAKTNLIEYYQQKLGAKFIGNNKMYIDATSSQTLYNQYYGGDKK